MTEALVLEFSGVTADQYVAVNGILGIDPATGAGDWPAGMLSHVGAFGDGTFIVFEMWDSQASQGAFMEKRLGPALGQVGLPEPSRHEWFTVEGHYPR